MAASYLSVAIGLKVSYFRKKCDISQSQLAEKIGVTRASIVNIEHGRQLPPIDRLLNIAIHLNVEVSDFLPSKAEFEKNKDKTAKMVIVFE